MNAIKRADESLAKASDALNRAVLALPMSAIVPLGVVLDAIRDARAHLAEVES